MKTKIKTQNYWMLKDISLWGIQSRKEVQGGKLEAIYRLIQKKGELIKSNNQNLKGVKALEFGDGEFIAMKRTGSNKKFFPCAIKTISLTILTRQ